MHTHITQDNQHFITFPTDQDLLFFCNALTLTSPFLSLQLITDQLNKINKRDLYKIATYFNVTKGRLSKDALVLKIANTIKSKN